MSTLENFPKSLFDQYNGFRKDIPSMIHARTFIENLINFLFPFKTDRKCTLPQIELNFAQLQIDFKGLIGPLEGTLDKPITQITEEFFTAIPGIYDDLMDDARHFIDFDPAAKSVESVVLYYPGFYAISVYRLAHVLYKLRVPFLPRMMSEYAHNQTGVDIHPGASIGKNFLIDHGTGIVIGETATIGSNVKIYQGVTLGALFVDKSQRGQKRHPSIENNVIIYAGSTILGGKTVIGENSIIGGNTWVTKSIPANSIVYHDAKTVIRNGNIEDASIINFVI